ncbi:AAA family ATPase [Petrotoga sp. 9PWA.NaAc.5.4]|uniref:AAA family ATPase n=1 Tax=Petrotoga sp. 9PWA.NaAc.5.4 TaxID=1434328 RepID=UPI000CB419A2|nr:AAA family ATPase [Petrotoga sp. 9PWA.NaAc.5.4]PNR94666.1 hypothetical protein X924_06135 [Petrotoga sp. 9PWA.NaAc.5.4]
MKIKEFFISHYGPLENREKIKLADFNLIWSKNEGGKTLTIEAIIKLLFKKGVKEFENLNRVEEVPEGYMILESIDGKEHKLSNRGEFNELKEFTPTDFKNIFIVRNSDISIEQSKNSGISYYENITERLTGLRTNEINKISQKVGEMARLTHKGLFRDVGEEKLKTRIDEAKKLIEKIEEIIKDSQEKGLEQLEVKIVTLKEKLKEIDNQINLLEEVRKREKYETGSKALNTLKTLIKEIKELDIYNEAEAKEWETLEQRLKNYNSEKEQKEKDLQAKETELDETTHKQTALTEEFKLYEEKKRKIDGVIRPKIEEYKSLKEDNIKQEKQSKTYTILSIVSVTFFAFFLLASIFQRSAVFYTLTGVSAIASFSFIFLRYITLKSKSHTMRSIEEFITSLKELELLASSVNDIYSKIQDFERLYRQKSEELTRFNVHKENLEKEINKIKLEDIPEKEQNIKETKLKIQEIKDKSKETSLESYNEKLKLKMEIQKDIEKQESVLKSHFGNVEGGLEKAIQYWEDEISKFEIFKDAYKDLKYSEEELSKLQSETKKCQIELEKIKNELNTLQKRFEEVERQANYILNSQEPIICNTLVDLQAIKELLFKFVDTHENNRKNALEVIDIFTEIANEEKTKISQLFGKDSRISKYFREITNNMYEEAIFDVDENKIKVKRKDGVILSIEQLSGGTYDQLYFSIRLALGEALMASQSGFFILDDPFVKSDSERLIKQIAILKNIVKSGWQVIYFSSKDEVKDLLKEDIAKKEVNFIELPPLIELDSLKQ